MSGTGIRGRRISGHVHDSVILCSMAQVSTTFAYLPPAGNAVTKVTAWRVVLNVVVLLGHPVMKASAGRINDGQTAQSPIRMVFFPAFQQGDNLIQVKGEPMTQKCANPECNAEFRFASRGRVFSFELRKPIAPCRDVPPAICKKKPSHAAIHFWLCENCSSRLSLRFTMETGLSIVAISKPNGSDDISESLKRSTPPPAAQGLRSA